MVKEVKASVIVPIYNIEQYLDECIESLVNQTCQDIEILLIDDGSKDASGDIADKWALSDSRIRVFHQVNKGVSEARNLGLREAVGKYVLFVDSDDYVSEKYVEELVNALEKERADVSMCRFFMVGTEGMTPDTRLPDTVEVMDAECYLEKLYRYPGHYAYTCMKAFRRTLFEGLSFEPNKRNEDARILIYLMLRAKKIVHVPQGLYFYRKRSSSAMNATDPNRLLKFELEWLQLHLDVLKEKGKEKLYGLAMIQYLKKITDYYIYISGNNRKEYRKELREKRKFIVSCSDISLKTKCYMFFRTCFPVSYGVSLNVRQRIARRKNDFYN